MERKFRCKRCGYVWKSSGSDYCLRCYSREIAHPHLLRDKASDAGTGIVKGLKSHKKTASGKFFGLRDYLIDFWSNFQGIIFVVLIFILILILAMIYVYWF